MAAFGGSGNEVGALGSLSVLRSESTGHTLGSYRLSQGKGFNEIITPEGRLSEETQGGAPHRQ